MIRGPFNVAHLRGNYSKCTIRTFKVPFWRSPKDLDVLIEDFFSQHNNLLVVDVQHISPRCTKILFGQMLTDEEIRESAEVSAEVNKILEERKAIREVERSKVMKNAKAKADMEAAEHEKYEKLGRRCEVQHKPLLQKERELKVVK